MEQQTVLVRLTALYPQAKKNTLREMIEGKRVLLNGALVRSLKQPVTTDDKLEVLETVRARTTPTALGEGLKLVHFDSDIAIVEKPAGLLTSTDAEEKRPTALRILFDYFHKQNAKNNVHLIHRLDRDASGLLVFARTTKAFTSLKQQFFEHTITRQYDVIAHGSPKLPKSRLENYLVENPQTGAVTPTPDVKAGKLAILDYEVLETKKSPSLSHLRCTLFTGRKHQIRVQLKAIGCPVCGDPLYGVADEPPFRMALHASHLSLDHPRTRRRLSFDSVMPRSFTHLVRS